MKSSRRISTLDLPVLDAYRYSAQFVSELQRQANQGLGQVAGNPNDTEQIARVDNDPDFYHALPYVVNPDLTYQRLGISQLIPIYEHLAQDAHISGIIQRMYAGLIRFEYHIQPGGNRKIDKLAAALCERILDTPPSPNFSWSELFFKMYEAVLYGFDLKEIAWDYQGKYLIPVELIDVPRRRVLFSPYGFPMVRTRTNFLGEPLHINNYLLTRHRHTIDNPYGQAALSSCYKLVKYKEAVIDFYVKFLEKHGSPWVVGKYPPGTTDAQIDTILNQLNDMRDSACAAVPDNVLVELVEAKSTDKMAYNGFIEMVNSELSKAILSSTLGVEIQDQGSRAAASTHLEAEHMVTEAHRKMVANTINHLFRLVSQFNFSENARSPYFEFFEKSEVKKVTADFLDKVRKMLPVSQSFASDILQVELANEGEAILPGFEGDWGKPPDVPITEAITDTNSGVLPATNETQTTATTETPSPVATVAELPKEEQQIEDGLERRETVAFSAFPGYDSDSEHSPACNCGECLTHHEYAAKNWLDTLTDEPLDIIKLRSARNYSRFLADDLSEISGIVDRADTLEELQRNLFSYYQAPREVATKNLAEATTLAWLLGYQSELEHARSDK